MIQIRIKIFKESFKVSQSGLHIFRCKHCNFYYWSTNSGIILHTRNNALLQRLVRHCLWVLLTASTSFDHFFLYFLSDFFVSFFISMKRRNLFLLVSLLCIKKWIDFGLPPFCPQKILIFNNFLCSYLYDNKTYF